MVNYFTNVTYYLIPYASDKQLQYKLGVYHNFIPNLYDNSDYLLRDCLGLWYHHKSQYEMIPVFFFFFPTAVSL